MKNKFITSTKLNTRNGGQREEKVTVILLAENYGYRMKSYGPISLVKIGDKTLLEHQIESIQAAFLDFEVILCSGFETQKVYQFVHNHFPRSLPIRIVENQVYYHSNCCEGVRLCMNNTSSDKIIVCGGGVMLNAEYLKQLNMKKSSILCQKGEKNSQFDVGVIGNGEDDNDPNSRLENLSLAAKNLVWTELLYITGEPVIRSFYNLVSKPEMKNKFLFEAINNWKGRKQLTISESKDNKIIKIDNIKTLKGMIKTP